MQIILPQLPEIGKTYICNISDAPEIKARIKVEELLEISADPELGIEAGFITTCSFPDEPDGPYIELLSDEWTASGCSLEVN